MSDCTSGFPTLFHIDSVVNGRPTLSTRAGRQVLVPDINFTCNGSITRWIFGARWQGDDDAYTELQIWRKISDNQYMKVNGTSLIVDAEIESGVYEYELETPLAFQEGDILGYFQPERRESQLALYVENTDRITTYHMLSSQELAPPIGPGAVFTIDNTNTDTGYPLIAVRTGATLSLFVAHCDLTLIPDPPDFGCGFMSEERVYALLDIPPLNIGIRREFHDNKQLLFPDISFTCHGEVMKLITAGSWNGDDEDNQFPELQIWRLLEGSTYKKLNGTLISATSEEEDEVYEYPVDPPLPFQPRDILGILTPDESGFSYDDSG